MIDIQITIGSLTEVSPIAIWLKITLYFPASKKKHLSKKTGV
ncbi:protein of unknown function [Xenorhabdus nematophila AN6/1]|nr:protein of unknown function [Xenorhabdus nematophila AN6/1]